MRLRQSYAGLFIILGSVGLLLTAGCTGPQAKLRAARCQRLQDRDGLQALAFMGDVEARELAQTQLVFRAELFDSKGTPIKSQNRSFQDQRGNVSAARTFMVHTSPWATDNLRLTIPARELEVTARDMPAWARVGVYRADGACLAYRWVQLPLDPSADLSQGATLARAPDKEEKTKEPADTAPRTTEEPPAEEQSRLARRPRPEQTAPPIERPTRTARAEPSAEVSDEPKAPAPPKLPERPDESAQPKKPADGPAPARSASTETPTAPSAQSEARTHPPPGSVAGPEDIPTGEQAGSGDPSAPRQSAEEPAVHSGPGMRTYRVQVGDTLSSIAQEQYGQAHLWETILAANPAIDPSHLRVGQTIVLPPVAEEATPASEHRPAPRPTTGDHAPKQRAIPPVYVVRPGDTLTHIARRVLGDALRWREIYDLNRDQLATPNRLRIGMRLRMPQGAKKKQAPSPSRS